MKKIFWSLFLISKLVIASDSTDYTSNIYSFYLSQGVPEQSAIGITAITLPRILLSGLSAGDGKDIENYGKNKKIKNEMPEIREQFSTIKASANNISNAEPLYFGLAMPEFAYTITFAYVNSLLKLELTTLRKEKRDKISDCANGCIIEMRELARMEKKVWISDPTTQIDLKNDFTSEENVLFVLEYARIGYDATTSYVNENTAGEKVGL